VLSRALALYELVFRSWQVDSREFPLFGTSLNSHHQQKAQHPHFLHFTSLQPSKFVKTMLWWISKSKEGSGTADSFHEEESAARSMRDKWNSLENLMGLTRIG